MILYINLDTPGAGTPLDLTQIALVQRIINHVLMPEFLVKNTTALGRDLYCLRLGFYRISAGHNHEDFWMRINTVTVIDYCPVASRIYCRFASLVKIHQLLDAGDLTSRRLDF